MLFFVFCVDLQALKAHNDTLSENIQLKTTIQKLQQQLEALQRKNESLQFTVNDLTTRVQQEQSRRFDAEFKLRSVRQQSGECLSFGVVSQAAVDFDIASAVRTFRIGSVRTCLECGI